MKRSPALAALLALLAGSQTLAAPPAPTGSPRSAACARALDTLREREDRVLAAAREKIDAARQSMLQARRTAALACLRETGDDSVVPPSTRIEVPPTAPPRTASPLTPPRPAATPKAVPAPPVARTLGACDANGCWTSDGVRLQRVGPQLLGPNGFCSTTGASVQCP